MSETSKSKQPFDEIIDSRTGSKMEFVGDPGDHPSSGKQRITIVLDNLRDSRTGRTIIFEEEVADPEKRFAELREISERARSSAERTLELFSMPCNCGMPWCPNVNG